MTPEERGRAVVALGGGLLIPYDVAPHETVSFIRSKCVAYVAQAIRDAIAEEREACATTAETMECPVHGDDYPRCMFDDDIGDAACREKRRSIAAMIRARGTA